MSIWNPIPRFQRIDKGFCPDCDRKLDHNGYCDCCHLVPSLDPEFQQWLSEKGRVMEPTLQAPKGLNAEDLTYWYRRAATLLGQPVIIIRSA